VCPVRRDSGPLPNTRSGGRLALVNNSGAPVGSRRGRVRRRPSLEDTDEDPVLVRFAAPGDSGACQLIGLSPSG